MAKQKGFRLSEETERKFLELVKLYNAKSENHAFELMVNELYELKKSKALVPLEELDRRDRELQKAIYELGRTRGELEVLKKELEELKKKDKHRSFWSKLFRRWGGG